MVLYRWANPIIRSCSIKIKKTGHLSWQGKSSPWWRHQMETFSAILPICAGNSPAVTGEFPAQTPVARSFDVFFDLRWITGWVKMGEVGDLRLHRIHYDFIVMHLHDYSIVILFRAYTLGRVIHTLDWYSMESYWDILEYHNIIWTLFIY